MFVKNLKMSLCVVIYWVVFIYCLSTGTSHTSCTMCHFLPLRGQESWSRWFPPYIIANPIYTFIFVFIYFLIIEFLLQLSAHDNLILSQPVCTPLPLRYNERWRCRTFLNMYVPICPFSSMVSLFWENFVRIRAKLSSCPSPEKIFSVFIAVIFCLDQILTRKTTLAQKNIESFSAASLHKFYCVCKSNSSCDSIFDLPFYTLSRLPYATLKTHKDGDCQAFVKTPTNC